MRVDNVLLKLGLDKIAFVALVALQPLRGQAQVRPLILRGVEQLAANGAPQVEMDFLLVNQPVVRAGGHILAEGALHLARW